MLLEVYKIAWNGYAPPISLQDYEMVTIQQSYKLELGSIFLLIPKW